MRLSATLVLLVVVCFSGCTSFKTTSLFRKSGHKVVPQKTNAPLKGLPVKMKVPSHVNVVVYEQQLILAADANERTAMEAAVNNAATNVASTKGALKKLASEIQSLKKSVAESKFVINNLTMKLDSIPAKGSPADATRRAAIIKLLRADKAVLEKTEALLALRESTRAAEEAKLNLSLDLQNSALIAAKANSQTGYRLVSFNPPQYVVDSELQYTDKVFLVDFKRPAGGVLDVTSVKMDDEQYFADVQAEVTERTVEDISSVLASFTPGAKSTEAKPTSADTPEAEANPQVHFQKSVVAMKRFDISQHGWEDQMMEFVNGRLQGTGETISSEMLPYEVHASAGFSK